ncbi:MAG: hypothetical protein PHV30_01950 [Candidatus Margulisbacteria bacterium]|nr:hypothetical protein [Candidatus Margulisiibacteriota bacterium]
MVEGIRLTFNENSAKLSLPGKEKISLSINDINLLAGKLNYIFSLNLNIDQLKQLDKISAQNGAEIANGLTDENTQNQSVLEYLLDLFILWDKNSDTLNIKGDLKDKDIIDIRTSISEILTNFNKNQKNLVLNLELLKTYIKNVSQEMTNGDLLKLADSSDKNAAIQSWLLKNNNQNASNESIILDKLQNKKSFDRNDLEFIIAYRGQDKIVETLRQKLNMFNINCAGDDREETVKQLSIINTLIELEILNKQLLENGFITISENSSIKKEAMKIYFENESKLTLDDLLIFLKDIPEMADSYAKLGQGLYKPEDVIKKSLTGSKFMSFDSKEQNKTNNNDLPEEKIKNIDWGKYLPERQLGAKAFKLAYEAFSQENFTDAIMSKFGPEGDSVNFILKADNTDVKISFKKDQFKKFVDYWIKNKYKEMMPLEKASALFAADFVDWAQLQLKQQDKAAVQEIARDKLKAGKQDNDSETQKIQPLIINNHLLLTDGMGNVSINTMAGKVVLKEVATDGQEHHLGEWIFKEGINNFEIPIALKTKGSQLLFVWTDLDGKKEKRINIEIKKSFYSEDLTRGKQIKKDELLKSLPGVKDHLGEFFINPEDEILVFSNNINWKNIIKDLQNNPELKSFVERLYKLYQETPETKIKKPEKYAFTLADINNFYSRGKGIDAYLREHTTVSEDEAVLNYLKLNQVIIDKNPSTLTGEEAFFFCDFLSDKRFVHLKFMKHLFPAYKIDDSFMPASGVVSPIGTNLNELIEKTNKELAKLDPAVSQINSVYNLKIYGNYKGLHQIIQNNEQAIIATVREEKPADQTSAAADSLNLGNFKINKLKPEFAGIHKKVIDAFAKIDFEKYVPDKQQIAQFYKKNGIEAYAKSLGKDIKNIEAENNWAAFLQEYIVNNKSLLDDPIFYLDLFANLSPFIITNISNKQVSVIDDRLFYLLTGDNKYLNAKDMGKVLAKNNTIEYNKKKFEIEKCIINEANQNIPKKIKENFANLDFKNYIPSIQEVKDFYGKNRGIELFAETLKKQVNELTFADFFEYIKKNESMINNKLFYLDIFTNFYPFYSGKDSSEKDLMIYLLTDVTNLNAMLNDKSLYEKSTNIINKINARIHDINQSQANYKVIKTRNQIETWLAQSKLEDSPDFTVFSSQQKTKIYKQDEYRNLNSSSKVEDDIKQLKRRLNLLKSGGMLDDDNSNIDLNFQVAWQTVGLGNSFKHSVSNEIKGINKFIKDSREGQVLDSNNPEIQQSIKFFTDFEKQMAQTTVLNGADSLEIFTMSKKDIQELENKLIIRYRGSGISCIDVLTNSKMYKSIEQEAGKQGISVHNYFLKYILKQGIDIDKLNKFLSEKNENQDTLKEFLKFINLVDRKFVPLTDKDISELKTQISDKSKALTDISYNPSYLYKEPVALLNFLYMSLLSGFNRESVVIVNEFSLQQLKSLVECLEKSAYELLLIYVKDLKNLINYCEANNIQTITRENLKIKNSPFDVLNKLNKKLESLHYVEQMLTLDLGFLEQRADVFFKTLEGSFQNSFAAENYDNLDADSVLKIKLLYYAKQDPKILWSYNRQKEIYNNPVSDMREKEAAGKWIREFYNNATKQYDYKFVKWMFDELKDRSGGLKNIQEWFSTLGISKYSGGFYELLVYIALGKNTEFSLRGKSYHASEIFDLLKKGLEKFDAEQLSFDSLKVFDSDSEDIAILKTVINKIVLSINQENIPVPLIKFKEGKLTDIIEPVGKYWDAFAAGYNTPLYDNTKYRLKKLIGVDPVFLGIKGAFDKAIGYANKYQMVNPDILTIYFNNNMELAPGQLNNSSVDMIIAMIRTKAQSMPEQEKKFVEDYIKKWEGIRGTGNEPFYITAESVRLDFKHYYIFVLTQLLTEVANPGARLKRVYFTEKSKDLQGYVKEADSLNVAADYGKQGLMKWVDPVYNMFSKGKSVQSEQEKSKPGEARTKGEVEHSSVLDGAYDAMKAVVGPTIATDVKFLLAGWHFYAVTPYQKLDKVLLNPDISSKKDFYEKIANISKMDPNNWTVDQRSWLKVAEEASGTGIDLAGGIWIFRNNALVLLGFLGFFDQLEQKNYPQAALIGLIATYFMMPRNGQSFWNSWAGRTLTPDKIIWEAVRLMKVLSHEKVSKESKLRILRHMTNAIADQVDPKSAERFRKMGDQSSGILDILCEKGVVGSIADSIGKSKIAREAGKKAGISAEKFNNFYNQKIDNIVNKLTTKNPEKASEFIWNYVASKVEKAKDAPELAGKAAKFLLNFKANIQEALKKEYEKRKDIESRDLSNYEAAIRTLYKLDQKYGNFFARLRFNIIKEEILFKRIMVPILAKGLPYTKAFLNTLFSTHTLAKGFSIRSYKDFQRFMQDKGSQIEALTQKYKSPHHADMINTIESDAHKQVIAIDKDHSYLKFAEGKAVPRLYEIIDNLPQYLPENRDAEGYFIDVQHQDPDTKEITTKRIRLKQIVFGSVQTELSGKSELILDRPAKEFLYLEGGEASLHLPSRYLAGTQEDIRKALKEVIDLAKTEVRDWEPGAKTKKIAEEKAKSLLTGTVSNLEKNKIKLDATEKTLIDGVIEHLTQAEAEDFLQEVKNRKSNGDTINREWVYKHLSEKVFKHDPDRVDKWKATEILFDTASDINKGFSEWLKTKPDLINSLEAWRKAGSNDIDNLQDAKSIQELLQLYWQEKEADIRKIIQSKSSQNKSTNPDNFLRYVEDNLKNYMEAELFSQEVNKNIQELVKTGYKEKSVEEKQKLIDKKLAEIKKEAEGIVKDKVSKNSKRYHTFVKNAMEVWAMSWNAAYPEEFPFIEQLTATYFSVINDSIAINANAGEGKTKIITGIAFIKYLLGEKSIIGVSNDADRAAGVKSTKRIFKFLKMNVDEYTPADAENIERARGIFNNNDVVYTIHSDLQFRRLYDGLTPEKRVLPITIGEIYNYILDEADKNKNIEGINPAIISISGMGFSPDEANYKKCYELVKKLVALHSENHEMFIKNGESAIFTENGLKELDRLIKQEKFKQSEIDFIKGLAGDMLVAEVIYVRGRQYQKIDGRIVLIDMGMRRIQDGRKLQGRIHNCIEAKERMRITKIDIPPAEVTTDAFVKIFKGLIYLSGTMLDYSESTAKSGIDTKAIRPHVPRKLKIDTSVMCKDIATQRNKLILGIAQQLVRGNSVLSHIPYYEYHEGAQLDIKSVNEGLMTLFDLLEMEITKDSKRKSELTEKFAKNPESAKFAKELLKELGGDNYVEAYKKALEFNKAHAAKSGLRQKGHYAERFKINLIKETTAVEKEQTNIEEIGNGFIQVLLSANTNRAVDVQMLGEALKDAQKKNKYKFLEWKLAQGYNNEGIVGFSTQLKADSVFYIQEIYRLARTSGIKREEGRIYGIYSLEDMLLSGEERFRDIFKVTAMRDEQGRVRDAIVIGKPDYPPNALLNIDYNEFIKYLDQNERQTLDKILDKIKKDPKLEIKTDRVLSEINIFDFDKHSDLGKNSRNIVEKLKQKIYYFQMARDLMAFNIINTEQSRLLIKYGLIDDKSKIDTSDITEYGKLRELISNENIEFFDGQQAAGVQKYREGIESNRAMQKARGKTSRIIHHITDLLSKGDSFWEKAKPALNKADLPEEIRSNYQLLEKYFQNPKDDELVLRESPEKMAAQADTDGLPKQFVEMLKDSGQYKSGRDLEKIKDIPGLMTRIYEVVIDSATEEFVKKNNVKNINDLVTDQKLREQYLKFLSQKTKLIGIKLDQNSNIESMAEFKEGLMKVIYNSAQNITDPVHRREVIKIITTKLALIQRNLGENIELINTRTNKEQSLRFGSNEYQQMLFEQMARHMTKEVCEGIVQGKKGFFRSFKFIERVMGERPLYDYSSDGVILSRNLTKLFFPSECEVKGVERGSRSSLEIQLADRIRQVYIENNKQAETVVQYKNYKYDLKEPEDIKKLNTILRAEGSRLQIVFLDKQCILGEVDIKHDQGNRTLTIKREIQASPGLRLLGAVYVEKTNYFGDDDKYEVIIREKPLENYMQDMLKEAFGYSGANSDARKMFDCLGIKCKEDWEKMLKEDPKKVRENLAIFIEFVKAHEEGHISGFKAKFGKANEIFPRRMHELAELTADFCENGVLDSIVGLLNSAEVEDKARGKAKLYLLMHFHRNNRSVYKMLQDVFNKNGEPIVSSLIKIKKTYQTVIDKTSVELQKIADDPQKTEIDKGREAQKIYDEATRKLEGISRKKQLKGSKKAATAVAEPAEGKKSTTGSKPSAQVSTENPGAEQPLPETKGTEPKPAETKKPVVIAEDTLKKAWEKLGLREGVDPGRTYIIESKFRHEFVISDTAANELQEAKKEFEKAEANFKAEIEKLLKANGQELTYDSLPQEKKDKFIRSALEYVAKKDKNKEGLTVELGSESDVIKIEIKPEQLLDYQKAAQRRNTAYQVIQKASDKGLAVSPLEGFPQEYIREQIDAAVEGPGVYNEKTRVKTVDRPLLEIKGTREEIEAKLDSAETRANLAEFFLTGGILKVVDRFKRAELLSNVFISKSKTMTTVYKMGQGAASGFIADVLAGIVKDVVIEHKLPEYKELVHKGKEGAANFTAFEYKTALATYIAGIRQGHGITAFAMLPDTIKGLANLDKNMMEERVFRYYKNEQIGNARDSKLKELAQKEARQMLGKAQISGEEITAVQAMVEKRFYIQALVQIAKDLKIPLNIDNNMDVESQFNSCIKQIQEKLPTEGERSIAKIMALAEYRKTWLMDLSLFGIETKFNFQEFDTKIKEEILKRLKIFPDVTKFDQKIEEFCKANNIADKELFLLEFKEVAVIDIIQDILIHGNKEKNISPSVSLGNEEKYIAYSKQKRSDPIFKSMLDMEIKEAKKYMNQSKLFVDGAGSFGFFMLGSASMQKILKAFNPQTIKATGKLITTIQKLSRTSSSFLVLLGGTLACTFYSRLKDPALETILGKDGKKNYDYYEEKLFSGVAQALGGLAYFMPSHYLDNYVDQLTNNLGFDNEKIAHTLLSVGITPEVAKTITKVGVGTVVDAAAYKYANKVIDLLNNSKAIQKLGAGTRFALEKVGIKLGGRVGSKFIPGVGQALLIMDGMFMGTEYGTQLYDYIKGTTDYQKSVQKRSADLYREFVANEVGKKMVPKKQIIGIFGYNAENLWSEFFEDPDVDELVFKDNAEELIKSNVALSKEENLFMKNRLLRVYHLYQIKQKKLFRAVASTHYYLGKFVSYFAPTYQDKQSSFVPFENMIKEEDVLIRESILKTLKNELQRKAAELKNYNKVTTTDTLAGSKISLHGSSMEIAMAMAILSQSGIDETGSEKDRNFLKNLKNLLEKQQSSTIKAQDLEELLKT